MLSRRPGSKTNGCSKTWTGTRVWGVTSRSTDRSAMLLCGDFGYLPAFMRIAKASRATGKVGSQFKAIHGGAGWSYPARIGVRPREPAQQQAPQPALSATPTLAGSSGRTTEPLWGMNGREATAAPNRNLTQGEHESRNELDLLRCPRQPPADLAEWI